MDLSVTVPDEPADRVAVLDADFVVWQRRDDLAPPDFPDRRWLRTGATRGLFGWAGMATWAHLVVDSRSLRLLVPEDEVDGWQRAGYVDPLAEHLPDAVGGPGAPTPDDGGTDGPSAADRAYAATTAAATDELGAPLPVATPSSRRPVRDAPQA